MSDKESSDRRSFIKLCAGAAATAASYPETLIGSVGSGEFFNPTLLLDNTGHPLRASRLIQNQSYVFFYPFISTPCFLIRLDRQVNAVTRLQTALGEEYEWTGGAGQNQQIVAFSAICAHKMSHPTSQVSFINYRREEVQFAGADRKFHKRSAVIFCCSEGSVYDPAEGGRVLGGPAPNPLAAILLEHEPQTDHLYAVGVAGETMFEPFFKLFADRLRLEFKTDHIDKPIEDTTRVMRLEDYCGRQILC